MLTGVGLEHTRWLGPTIADIAEEKLAVVRDHSTLVTAPLEPAARAVAERVAAERHARWIESPALADVPLRAAGAFQRQNFALACAAAEAFLGRALDPGAVADAAAETRIPGRLDPVVRAAAGAARRRPQPGRGAGAGAGAARGAGRRGARACCVASVLEDKDAAAMLEALLRAVRRGGVHPLREPARAVAGHAGVAGRAHRADPRRAQTVPDPADGGRAGPLAGGPRAAPWW